MKQKLPLVAIPAVIILAAVMTLRTLSVNYDSIRQGKLGAQAENK